MYEFIISYLKIDVRGGFEHLAVGQFKKCECEQAGGQPELMLTHRVVVFLMGGGLYNRAETYKT